MAIVIANRDINRKGPVKAGQPIEIPDAELKAYLADGFTLPEKPKRKVKPKVEKEEK